MIFMQVEKKYSEETTEQLEKLKSKIRENVVWIDIKPYSHNIIGLALLQISKLCGKEETNKCIDEFNLEGKGWSKVE